MGKKREKLYSVILDGIQDGLKSQSLNKYILNKLPNASSKQIVKASLLAFSNVDVLDEKKLQQVCGLAIQHRLIDLNLSKPAQRTERDLDIVELSPDKEQIIAENPIPPVDLPTQSKPQVAKRRAAQSKSLKMHDGI